MQVSNVAAPAVVRVARGAGAVGARAAVVVVRLALDDDAVAVVVAVDEEGEDEGDEEEDAVPDSLAFDPVCHFRFLATHMMPKAKAALSMAHGRLTSRWGKRPLTENHEPMSAVCWSPRVQLEQSASAMKRRT